MDVHVQGFQGICVVGIRKSGKLEMTTDDTEKKALPEELSTVEMPSTD